MQISEKNQNISESLSVLPNNLKVTFMFAH